MVDAASTLNTRSTSVATTAQSGTSQRLGKASFGEQSAEEKFLAFAKMTPAERMRAGLLSQLGLTEEQLRAMPPEEQQKVEQKITELIKDAAEKQAAKNGQTGFIADLKV